MNLNWNLLDQQWRERHDATQLKALESALDKALYNQGQERDYALLWRWARLSHFRAMQALQESEGGDSAKTDASEANGGATSDANGGATSGANGGEEKAAADSRSSSAKASSAKAKARGLKSGAAAREAARLHFAAGASEAFEAARLQPNRVEGHFWAGVNSIEASRLAGTIAAARALPQASRHIERSARIDETYHFAAPLRVSGRITHLRPMILGGNLDAAVYLLRRALQIAPQNSTTLLYLAQALRADRQPAEARSVLRQLVEAPIDPDWRWEQERDKAIAHTLLLPQQ